jgi:hypothetical protein
VNGLQRKPWNNSHRSQHTLVWNCRSYIWAGVTVLVVLILCKPAGGQTKHFWPEINLYKKLNSHSRFHFMTQLTRENDANTEMDLGVGQCSWQTSSLPFREDTGKTDSYIRTRSIVGFRL